MSRPLPLPPPAPSPGQTSSSGSGATALVGSSTPRLWTPPLRPLVPDRFDEAGALLEPATSVGFDQIDFARNVLARPLDPWQEFAAIHAGELLEDGSLRFRVVLLLVARQQGKTELIAILPAYWMAVDEVPLVLGLSTKLEYAFETWTKTRHLLGRAPALEPRRARRWNVEGNNRIEQWLSGDHPEGKGKSRYKIAAATELGGRMLTVWRLMFDEFRHTSRASWEAAEPTTSSVFDSQIWCTSNAGDDTSELLNEMRDAAVRFIETGEGDDSVCLLEWSAPLEADPRDPAALAMANPNLGRRTRPDRLLAKAHAAYEAGGAALTGFRTNYLCQRVKIQDPAIDPAHWANARDVDAAPAPGERRRALCLDVAPGGGHVTLAAAVLLEDERVLVGIVGAWSSTRAARRDLPKLLADASSTVLGWFPSGPGAALAADLADRSTAGRTVRPAALPPGMRSEEIRGELVAVCMGFEEVVRSGLLAHPADPMLDDQVSGAKRRYQGEVLWVFTRAGETFVDAVYAVAGAAHLVRTMPAPAVFRRLQSVPDES